MSQRNKLKKNSEIFQVQNSKVQSRYINQNFKKISTVQSEFQTNLSYLQSVQNAEGESSALSLHLCVYIRYTVCNKIDFLDSL